MIFGPIIALLSIFFAAMPLLIVALVIWSADVYNRKPIWTGLVALFWGAFGATTGAIVISMIFEFVLDQGFRMSYQEIENFQVVIVAPTMEEITKGIILLVMLFLPRLMESGTNGLVLGAMTGFGFAITENFLYYIGAYMTMGVEAWIATIILRTLFSTFIHVMASGIIGFCLGFGASRGHNPFEMPILLGIGYTLAVGIHMMWNLSATLSEQLEPGFILIGFLGFFFAAFCMLFLGLLSVYRDRKLLEREFEDEIHHGVLSLEDSFILTRWTRREALRFIFPGKLSNEFQKAALRLAIIKNQNRCYEKGKRNREIDELRLQIREMKMYSMIRDGSGRASRQIESFQTDNHQPGFGGQNPFLNSQPEMPQQSLANPPAGYVRSVSGHRVKPQFQETGDSTVKPLSPPPDGLVDLDPMTGQPYVGMASMPQHAPRQERPDDTRPPAPHSIQVINPREFRKRVRKAKGLEQAHDVEEENQGKPDS